MKKLARSCRLAVLMMFIFAIFGGTALAMPVQTMVPITGEIETITINNPADVWSGGMMTVGGHDVILPANLLINLPNDFQTLQQLYTNAPAACQITKETGLAKSDKCNSRATGAQANILANRTISGNVIAGVVDIFKALETVNGTVTFIDYTNGFFRLNGVAGDQTTGVMVRVNDPISRNTIQQGPGCLLGNTVNCSPDVRFKIDPDNYTFCYVTGYPACIPSTANGASTTGTGDPNCPDANRPPIADITTSNPFAPPPVAADSRHFAPVTLGDTIKADGSYETIGGVKFLSAWSVRVMVDLTTRITDSLGNPDTTQPDYLIINEASWDGPAYPAGRVRGRLLTNSTVRIPGVNPTTADIDYFSIHYDPVNNAPHEQILYTTQFNKQFGAVVFNTATGVSDSQVRFDFFPGAKSLGNDPCLALLGLEPKATGTPVFPGINISNFCLSGTDAVSNFNLGVPIFREVMARSTRQRTTIGGGLAAFDIHARPSQSGQYKLPTNINYGAFEDINLGMAKFPFQFSGTPWLLDRRLSPNGCAGVVCGGGPIGSPGFSLTPFPYEGIDPRTIAPTFGFVVLGQITQLPTPDRMFSSMDVNGNMITGNLVGLFPPAPFAGIPITPVPTASLFPPIANDVIVSTRQNTPITINVAAQDKSLLGSIDPASVTIVTPPALGTGAAVANVNGLGTITYTPPTQIPPFTGTVTFTYTIADSFGVVSSPATVTVLVSVSGTTFLVSTTTGGNGVIVGPGTAESLATPSYTIVPNTGFHVADVAVNNVSQGAITSLTLAPVNTNMTIAAIFAINVYAVTRTPDANGAIAGPATASHGSTPSYTVTPNFGYHVTDVQVDGVSKGAVTTVTLPPVTASVTITATFALNTYTITATSDSRGSMTPPGNASVIHGGSQEFSFTPNLGYNIVNVIVDGTAQGPLTSYTFSNVTGVHSIKAVFIPDGDLNDDGKVDVTDALRAIQIAVGLIKPSATDLLHGDVAPLGSDGIPLPDTQITAADALVILKKVVGLTSGW
jgi:Big-like domain-containing protein/List-Bact-rpt repeat protein